MSVFPAGRSALLVIHKADEDRKGSDRNGNL
jgi:hypothetical protein